MNKELLSIIYNKMIAKDIYEMKLSSNSICQEASCGQFINIALNDQSKLLKRPISICKINDDSLVITYKISGEGTKQMATYCEGEKLEAIGPLGHGFPVQKNSKILLVGGGIGVPPLLELAKQLSENNNEITVILAFRDKENIIYEEEFRKFGKVYITTDDGSYGYKGNAINYLDENPVDFDYIYSCGPEILLKKLEEKYAGCKGYLSYEARMACGVGLCHGCVKGEKHYCVCTDGPVFELGVIYNEFKS